MKKLSSKGISHLILPIIVVVAVGAIGTFAYVVSHAQTPTVQNSSNSKAISKICLNANTKLCLTAHGVGSTVTVQTSSDSRWYLDDILNSGGTHYYYITDGSGNCLKLNSAEGVAVIGEGGCINVPRDEWSSNSTVPLKYKNVYSGKYLGVESLGRGTIVNVGTPYSGYYWGWVIL